MGAVGHCAWLVLAQPGHAALPAAPAMGAFAVEVSQIQFIDDEVVEQFQFLDKFMVGPLLCTDSLSLLVGVQYIDKLLMCSCDAVACPLHAALLCNAWFDSEYMFCVSSRVFGRFAQIFYAKGNSDPEVVYCPALRCLVCESR